ncbi:MAG: TraR/DksA C4-type zinc finger protein [Rhodospirillales bacterium]|nr:TraR/DksA C4-type zinc finger protein [Rhodospirillales bacterium]
MNNQVKLDLDHFRAILQDRKEELLHFLAENSDAAKTVELDQTRVGRLSRMDALQNQEMAKETNRRRQAELLRIEAAFQRIEDGEFGECGNCGEDIAIKRLELDAAVIVCINCAS